MPHSPRLITEKAVSFIEKKRQQPFLLSVHYNAPHWPWETRADEAESKRIAQVPSKIYHFDGGSVVTYLTMIRQMDEAFGMKTGRGRPRIWQTMGALAAR